MGLCFFCPGAGLCSASQDPSFMTLCSQRLLWKLPPTLLPIKVDRIASRAERQRGREAEINPETSNCLPPPCRSPQGFCACCLWSLPSPPRFWLTQVSPLLPLRDASHFSIQMTGLFRDSLLTLQFKDGTRNPDQSSSQDWHWSAFPHHPSLSLSPKWSLKRLPSASTDSPSPCLDTWRSEHLGSGDLEVFWGEEFLEVSKTATVAKWGGGPETQVHLESV